jgi:hypothetical protein
VTSVSAAVAATLVRWNQIAAELLNLVNRAR